MIESYLITPTSKPRMTQRDKWKKRPCVQRYFAFRDEVKLNKVRVPSNSGHIIFVMPMPQSWSKKKRKAMYGQPHQQRPDKDNLEKALLDAVYDEDAVVWDGRTSKIWGQDGQIIILPAQSIQEIVDNHLIDWEGRFKF